MKTAIYYPTCHSQSLDKASYNLKTKVYDMNKWKKTGYCVDMKSVYIQKSNNRYIRFGNRKNIAYSLLATGIETNNPSYGICVSQSGHVVDYALDLSYSYEEVKSLVVLCNEEELQPIHFHNVLEDFFRIKY